MGNFKKILLVVSILITSVSLKSQDPMFFGLNNSIAGWELSAAVYNQGFNISATSESNLRGLYVSPDNSSLYTCGTTNDYVYQYSLSTSSLTFVRNLNINTISNPTFIYFKSDGLKMYIGNNTNIYQYNLSTAWNISTASYIGTKDITTYGASPAGFRFSDDGLSMYLATNTYTAVREYILTTAWLVSTADNGSNGDYLYIPHSMYSLTFSLDGSKMYIGGQFVTTKNVYQYNLSSPWTVLGATKIYELTTYPTTGYVYGIAFSSDGGRMFLTGGNSGVIYQYNL